MKIERNTEGKHIGGMVVLTGIILSAAAAVLGASFLLEAARTVLAGVIWGS